MEIVSSAELTISYDGDAVRAGVMDVQDLAPALLAASTLLRKSNQVLNGESTHVQLKVKSDFRKGSFDVNLIVDQGLIEQAKAFLALHPHIQDAKDILDILFFYVGIPYSVFKLIKELGGKKVDLVELDLDGDSLTLTSGDKKIKVNKKVFDIYRDPEVRKAVGQMVAPLRDSAIESLEIRRGKEIESVSKEQAAFFDFASIDAELILDNMTTAWLTIIGLSFNMSHKWRFTDGSSSFTANIEDQAFWRKVYLHEETFSEGDQLLVQLRTTTYRDAEGKLSTNRVITEVTEHLKSAKQINLPLK